MPAQLMSKGVFPNYKEGEGPKKYEKLNNDAAKTNNDDNSRIYKYPEGTSFDENGVPSKPPLRPEEMPTFSGKEMNPTTMDQRKWMHGNGESAPPLPPEYQPKYPYEGSTIFGSDKYGNRTDPFRETRNIGGTEYSFPYGRVPVTSQDYRPSDYPRSSNNTFQPSQGSAPTPACRFKIYNWCVR